MLTVDCPQARGTGRDGRGEHLSAGAHAMREAPVSPAASSTLEAVVGAEVVVKREVRLSSTQSTRGALNLVRKRRDRPAFVRSEPDHVPSERNGVVVDLEARDANSRVPLRRSDENSPELRAEAVDLGLVLPSRLSRIEAVAETIEQAIHLPLGKDAHVPEVRGSPITSACAARFRREALAPDPRLSIVQESQGREAGDSAFGLVEVRPVVPVACAEPSDRAGLQPTQVHDLTKEVVGDTLFHSHELTNSAARDRLNSTSCNRRSDPRRRHRRPRAVLAPTVSELSADCQRRQRGSDQARRSSAGSDNRVPDPDLPRSGGELVLLRRMIDDEVQLEPPRLEPLTAAQEGEAVELLGALFATAARRRVGVRTHEEAA